MSGLVCGDGAAFFFGGNFGFLFQAAHNAVNGFQEILLAHELSAVPCSYEGSLVAYVSNVCTREARRLPCQEVDVHTVVYLDGTQVYAEYFFPFIQVGQVYVNLSVETSGTQQGFVQHVHAVGGSQDDDSTV